MLLTHEQKHNTDKEFEDILSILSDDIKHNRKINNRMFINALSIIYTKICDHESRFDAIRASLRDR